jgi:hypothetical protein
VYLYAGKLSAADKSLTGVQLIDSVDETLRKCVAESGDLSVAVVPEGPYVVPVYQPG